MQTLNMINYYRGQYVITLNEDLKFRCAKEKSKRTIRIDAKFLHWTPKDWSKRPKWWKSDTYIPMNLLMKYSWPNEMNEE